MKFKTLFLGIFLCCSGCFCFALDNLNFFSLKIERTIMAGKNSVTVLGSMYYQAFPKYFEFSTYMPQKQTFCSTATKSYYKDAEGEFIRADESFKIIDQTCSDIKNWFNPGLNFSEQGYSVYFRQVENKKLIQKWNLKEKTNPIEKIISYSDEKGRFTELEMYLEDKSLMARTTLENYEMLDGRVFPTLIKTESYSEGKMTQLTVLKLLEVSFAPQKNAVPQKILKEIDGEDYFATVNSVFARKEHRKIEKNDDIDEDENSSQKKNHFSLLGFGVDCGYLFYKKFITSQDMTKCSYDPSCSNYMVQCVKKDGFLGFIEGMDRLSRCTSYEDRIHLYRHENSGKFSDKPGNLNKIAKNRKKEIPDRLNFYTEVKKSETENLTFEEIETISKKSFNGIEGTLSDLDKNRKNFADSLFADGFFDEAAFEYEKYILALNKSGKQDFSAAASLCRIYSMQENSSSKILELSEKTMSLEKQNLMYKKLSDSYKNLNTKSRAGATTLSLFFPGAGHIYLGNYRRAISSFLGVYTLSAGSFYAARRYGIKNWRPWLFGSMAAVDWITDIYGANKAAQRYNEMKIFEYEKTVPELFLEALYEN